ncbi:hypothetical protein DFA_07974 [Cavenderia fasciculata]|uniref:Uncharacterized protein n=1 Tax=Cavenderia fasciculata TaxID=261658 RepID=F4Q4D1_CACFS|nr:uncharacterized protein DFA_07974 [Cavenderia fasciculata]EGG16993.1 hypothetical protein DFA_07974 [Cavenderia fasciculata]|eukprot:XP_004355477.1 hypothetical protein DFA_07974 [Cavenderia fasciculata]
MIIHSVTSLKYFTVHLQRLLKVKKMDNNNKQTDNNNINIIERYRISSKSFKLLEDKKCPLCDSQLFDRTTLNHHIALCSIYFMRYNQINVDQMVNHVKDDDERNKRRLLQTPRRMMDIGLFRSVLIVNAYTRSIIIKHQRHINRLLSTSAKKLTKTQQELISLGLPDSGDKVGREGRYHCYISFYSEDSIADLIKQVNGLRRVIQQSKLVTYLSIKFYYSEIELARPYVNLIYQDLKENTTITEYSIDPPLFGRMIYAERPSTRFSIPEVQSFVYYDSCYLYIPFCLPSMVPHIDKYLVKSSAFIKQSCRTLTGSPYIKTVKQLCSFREPSDAKVFNQFTLSLPNLECIRLEWDKVDDMSPTLPNEWIQHIYDGLKEIHSYTTLKYLYLRDTCPRGDNEKLLLKSLEDDYGYKISSIESLYSSFGSHFSPVSSPVPGQMNNLENERQKILLLLKEE